MFAKIGKIINKSNVLYIFFAKSSPFPAIRCLYDGFAFASTPFLARFHSMILYFHRRSRSAFSRSCEGG